MTARFRRLYGAGPLHLLALIASLLIAGAAVAGWIDTGGSLTGRIVVWFVGAIVAHDIVLLPLYSLLDRIATEAARAAGPRGGPGADRTAARRAPARSSGWIYVRVPALLSGLILLVFFPEIFRLGNRTFHTASGMTQDVYVSRFLITCAVLFTGSAVAYAISLRRG